MIKKFVASTLTKCFKNQFKIMGKRILRSFLIILYLLHIKLIDSNRICKSKCQGIS